MQGAMLLRRLTQRTARTTAIRRSVARCTAAATDLRTIDTSASRCDAPAAPTPAPAAAAPASGAPGAITHASIGHWSPEEFRRNGYAMVDWIADYYKNLPNYPVLSTVKPNYLQKLLPTKLPAERVPFPTLMADVNRAIVPGITHWQSPNFYAYFPASASLPSLLGDLLCSAFSVVGFSWITSPAATELETIVLDWMADAMAFPTRFLSSSGAGVGIIQSTASESTLVAALSARTRVMSATAKRHPEWSADAVHAHVSSRLVCYASEHAHSSVKKAVHLIMGLPEKRFRLIESDPVTSAMRPDKLKAAIDADRAAGLIPFFVCGTYGTTSSGAIDPLLEIGQICRAGAASDSDAIYFHIDAAWAGSYWLLDEFKAAMKPVYELADSLCLNPHKLLLTNFDCSTLWVADRRLVYNTLSITPEYIRNAASDAGLVIDYRDLQVPLGRRMKALKLWFVLSTYGRSGLTAHLRHSIALTSRLEEWMRADARFEIVCARSFSLLCFRLTRPGASEAQLKALNASLMDALNASGSAFLTHTVLNGKYVLRWAIGSAAAEEKYVRATWLSVQQIATKLLLNP